MILSLILPVLEAMGRRNREKKVRFSDEFSPRAQRDDQGILETIPEETYLERKEIEREERDEHHLKQMKSDSHYAQHQAKLKNDGNEIRNKYYYAIGVRPATNIHYVGKAKIDENEQNLSPLNAEDEVIKRIHF